MIPANNFTHIGVINRTFLTKWFWRKNWETLSRSRYVTSMHVALHEIRRLSLLNYIYWWVRELFFRELDLKAFGILKCELVSRAVLDSEMNTEVCTEILLSGPLSIGSCTIWSVRPHSLNLAFPFFSYFAQETTILQLQAPQLEFLLDDLSRKLQYSLSASASSRRSFLKVSISILSTRDLWWKTANTNLKCT